MPTGGSTWPGGREPGGRVDERLDAPEVEACGPPDEEVPPGQVLAVPAEIPGVMTEERGLGVEEEVDRASVGDGRREPDRRDVSIHEAEAGLPLVPVARDAEEPGVEIEREARIDPATLPEQHPGGSHAEFVPAAHGGIAQRLDLVDPVVELLHRVEDPGERLREAIGPVTVEPSGELRERLADGEPRERRDDHVIFDLGRQAPDRATAWRGCGEHPRKDGHRRTRTGYRWPHDHFWDGADTQN